MNTLFIPLVDWGMGSFIIGVFAVVCIALVLVVYGLMRTDVSAPMPESTKKEDATTEAEPVKKEE